MGDRSQLVGYFSRRNFGSNGLIVGIYRGVFPNGGIGFGLVYRHWNSSINHNFDFHHTR
jgi:hypothetical protein